MGEINIKINTAVIFKGKKIEENDIFFLNCSNNLQLPSMLIVDGKWGGGIVPFKNSLWFLSIL